MQISADFIRKIESANEEDLKRLLLDDGFQDELETYFGVETYREMRQLVEAEQIAVGARRAPEDLRQRGLLDFLKPKRDGHIILLPGIMGSKLRDATPDGRGLIWIDPLGLLKGEFQYLRLRPGNDEDMSGVKIEPSGALWMVYLRLHLRLKQHFHVTMFDFDWRKPIEREADRLYQTFEQLYQESQKPVALVAHSMGGLVSRMMLQLHWNDGVKERLRRLVMLGTPNYGSFAAPQALSGDERLLGLLATVDIESGFGDMLQYVNTFTGLYQMMPTPEGRNPHFDGELLYNPTFWKHGLPLDQDRLKRAKQFQRTLGRFHQQLNKADREKFTIIAGDDFDTTVAITRQNDGSFDYRATNEGDGTVPHVYSHLEGVKTYYAHERHGALPRNGRVIQAVVDLIKQDTTQQLTQEPVSRARRGGRGEPELRAWTPPSRGDLKVRRELIQDAIQSDMLSHSVLQEFMPPAFLGIEPVELGASPAAIESPRELRPFVTSKAVAAAPKMRKQIRLTLALGSITEADVSALVVGQYPGVPPEGAVVALDGAVNGTISALYTQGSIHGEVGTLFFVPVLRSKLYASCIVLAGLGPVGRLTEEGLIQIGTQIIQGLDSVRIYDFATVLLGSGEGNLSVRQALTALLTGFYRGLEAYDPEGYFREVTLVEIDPARRLEIAQVLEKELMPLAAKQGVQIDFQQTSLEKPAARAALARELNVIVRSSNDALSYAVIGQAMTPELRFRIDQTMVNRILGRIEEAATGNQPVNENDFENLCLLLYQELFPREVQEAIRAESIERQFILNLDQRSARYPWELTTISVGTPDGFLGTRFSLSRRLSVAGQGSIMRWLAGKQLPKRLRMLIIADADGSLPGARREGEELHEQLNGAYDIKLRSGPDDCDALTILGEIERGEYDLVHYAGHAFFEDRAPEESGWIFKDGVLTARQWQNRQNLPALIFSNACESGIVERPQRAGEARAAADGRDFGLAESLLLAGLPNYIGTFWVIPDHESVFFAQAFYRTLASGVPIGDALRAARKATIQEFGIGNLAWSSYMLYGQPGLSLVSS